MNEKKLTLKLLLGIAVLFFVATAVPVMADTPGTWYGYATINDTLVDDNVIVSAHVNNVPTPTIQCAVRCGVADAGGYNLNVEAEAGDTVTFRVWGVPTYEGAQTWGPGAQTLLNLTINTSDNGIGCNYSQACSSDNCAEDYDNAGAWCAPAGSCSNNNATTASNGKTCYGNTLETCTNGTWVAEECARGCSNGACLTGGGGDATPSGAGGAAAPAAAPAEEAEGITPSPIESEVAEAVAVETVTVGEATTISIPLTGTLVVEELEIVTNKDITDAEITIAQQISAPADAKSPTLPKGGVVYGYVRVQTKGMESADMDSAKISFKLEKSWLKENNMDLSTVTLRLFDPKTREWTELLTKQVKTTFKYVYFEAESDHLSLFVITVEQEKEEAVVEEPEKEEEKPPAVVKKEEITPEEKKIPNWAYSAIVIVILALVGFGYWYSKQEAGGKKK